MHFVILSLLLFGNVLQASTISALNSAIGSAQSTISAQQATLRKLQSDTSALSSKISSVQAETSAFKLQITSLTASTIVLIDQRNEVSKEIKKLDEDLHKLKIEISKLEYKNRSLAEFRVSTGQIIQNIDELKAKWSIFQLKMEDLRLAHEKWIADFFVNVGKFKPDFEGISNNLDRSEAVKQIDAFVNNLPQLTEMKLLDEEILTSVDLLLEHVTETRLMIRKVPTLHGSVIDRDQIANTEFLRVIEQIDESLTSIKASIESTQLLVYKQSEKRKYLTGVVPVVWNKLILAWLNNSIIETGNFLVREIMAGLDGGDAYLGTKSLLEQDNNRLQATRKYLSPFLFLDSVKKSIQTVEDIAAAIGARYLPDPFRNSINNLIEAHRRGRQAALKTAQINIEQKLDGYMGERNRWVRSISGRRQESFTDHCNELTETLLSYEKPDRHHENLYVEFREKC